MTSKILASSKFLIPIACFLFFIPMQVNAEYYISYSAPVCDSCNRSRVLVTHYYKMKPSHHYRHYTCRPHYRHYRHHYAHYSRSHYKISVYYYDYSIYPACASQCGGCGSGCGCEPRPCVSCVPAPCYSRSTAFVGFSGEPTSYRGARYYSNEETEPAFYQDRATADDDANAFPEMNIDH